MTHLSTDQQSDGRPIKKKAGIDRSHDRSLLPKIAFCLLHLSSILFCIYLVWGQGVETFSEWARLSGWTEHVWTVHDPDRGLLLVGVTSLYWLRHCVTLFYLLVRKVEWGEVIGLSVFMLIFEVGLCLLGAGVFRDHIIPVHFWDGIAVMLILLGSFLNTGSEIQRKWWKRHSENKGHCYTRGLFAWSMHINYFGDTVLFTGWCLLTMNGWTLLLPLIMSLGFISYHIPGLDDYLEERYGDEFIEYSKKTKKFIPFIY